MWKYILFRLFRLMCFFLTFIHTYTYVTSVSGRIRLYFHSRCIQYMTHTQFVRGAQQKHSTYCVNLLFCIIYRMWVRQRVCVRVKEEHFILLAALCVAYTCVFVCAVMLEKKFVQLWARAWKKCGNLFWIFVNTHLSFASKLSVFAARKQTERGRRRWWKRKKGLERKAHTTNSYIRLT